tara:strand:+ start:51457 stop:54573 length:3117 start_codon:yes stop_codon:yes gene_type:complete
MNAPANATLLVTEGVVDYVTVLQCAKPLKLTKTWQANGTIRGNDKVKKVRMSRPSVGSFHGMCKLLDWIAERTDRAVIRGEPREAYPRGAVLLRDRHHFKDEAHHWVIFDVDGYEPSVDPVAHPEAAVEEFIAKELPECFHFRSCRWMLSSSAGKPGAEHLLKAHLMFWLVRPYTSAQLKLWALTKRLNVDDSLFNTVQWHYMSNPVFEDGVVDPVAAAGSNRYGIIDGFEHEVDLLIEEGLVREANARSSKPDGERNDPKQKRGIVGAFCRAFDIDDCFERWGEDFPYVPQNDGDTRRLTYLDGGGSPGGAYITDCREWLGSKHDSRPWVGRTEVHAFDLMRAHKFGHLDDATVVTDEDWPFDASSGPAPSFYAMKAWALKLPEVQEELQAMKAEEAAKPLAAPESDDECMAESEQKGPTAEEVIEKLRKLPASEVAAEWPGLAAELEPVERDRVLQEVVRLTGARVQPLKETLRQYKAARKRERKIAELQGRLAGRVEIEYDPLATTLQARQVEDLILKYLEANDRQHEYVVFAGRVCAMVEDRLPHSHAADDEDPKSAPLVPTLKALDRSAFVSRVEEVAGFLKLNDKGDEFKPAEVPLSILMHLQTGGREAPVVSGLVGHPLVRLNGEILGDRGMHRASGLVVAGAPVPGCRPYNQDEAREALQRLDAEFCAGFAFETPLDKAAALAALFTGVQRKVLDSAPGVLVLAASQNTGKTTLARRLHVILTGRDLPVVTFPPNPDEARKTLLALLLRSPALICFDNIPDGLNFRDASLAAVMTSSVWDQRVLGVTENVQVQTNTLFMVTGNNLSLGRDELTRMMGVRLVKPATKRRVFKHADVVGHALEIRTSVIRDVVGIVAGYLKSGLRSDAATRFQQWDRCVRQPLLWATEGREQAEDWDVARIFEKNEEESAEVAAASHVFGVLHEQFGSKRFTARDVVRLVVGIGPADFAFGDDEPGGRMLDAGERDLLHDALEAMTSKNPREPKSVGRVLQKYKGRVASDQREKGAQFELREFAAPHGRVVAEYVIRRIAPS